MDYNDFVKIKDKLIVPRVFKMQEKVPRILMNRNKFAAIFETYNQMEESIVSDMISNRLDRHKICACLCKSILQVMPLDTPEETLAGMERLCYIANEFLALGVAMDLMRWFLTTEFRLKYDHDLVDSQVYTYPELMYDRRNNAGNIIGSLYRSRMRSEDINSWLLSQKFYYVEVYNKGLMEGRMETKIAV
jgi:hypothetical protein